MATFGRVFPPVVDLKGTELILDADADTTITADTDDQIDIRIAGADDFQITANTMSVLSGSTLNIDSGASIVNSGTATGFGMDSESAYAGVLEANATFVDQAIFGPSVDGKSWNGKWSVASLYSSLMLVTIETDATDTQVNIWDLTEVSSSAPSTTPLGTVTLSGDATPTSVAACMGYIIVGSEDGISIIDPHSGSWAERTVGWPRSLSTSTTPALTDNDVQSVAAGLSDQPAYDPRTGGPFPTFGLVYGTGADCSAIIKDDGTFYDQAGTVGGKGCAIFNGFFIYPDTAAGRMKRSGTHITGITADDWAEVDMGQDASYPQILGSDQQISFSSTLGALCDANGLSLVNGLNPVQSGRGIGMSALINRTYNTGYLPVNTVGAWLANSATADRSYAANTLTETGTVTEAAVESGAELMGYSGFTTSNYFSLAYDADLDFGTTFSVIGWFKTTGTSTTEYFFERKDPSDTARQFRCAMFVSGAIEFEAMNAAANLEFSVTTSGYAWDDSVWHHIAMWRDGTNAYMYIDGTLVASDSESITDTHVDSNATLAIGATVVGTAPATTTTLALWRFSATVPTATQVRQMYDAEKGMFVASAECLLQSSSTDAVLDVNVDPLTNKVLVTQTDAITVFDGLVVDSKPTVNAGASEKGKLWGDLRAEQNDTNAYVTAPAVDQRQVNEMVRGLASDLPAGPDLSKAAAWISFDGTGTISITASYNIKKIVDMGTGFYEIHFATLFKATNYVSTGSAAATSANEIVTFYDQSNKDGKALIEVYVRNPSDTALDRQVWCVFFGELENE